MKAVIVAESYASADSVCAVARRHGLTPQQLFTWRLQARGALDTPAPSLFVQAVVEQELPAPVLAKPRRQRGSRVADSGLIEVEIDGVVVRVGRVGARAWGVPPAYGPWRGTSAPAKLGHACRQPEQFRKARELLSYPVPGRHPAAMMAYENGST